MLRFEAPPTTPGELAVLARGALVPVLCDLIEMAGAGGRTGVRARRLLKDLAGAIASNGGAMEKPGVMDGGDPLQPSSHPVA